MPEVHKTEEFHEWLSSLRDQKAKAKIASRIERLGLGNPGDVKPVGQGVSEMRVPYGPGYRVYFKQPTIPSSFSYAVETSRPKRRTSNERKK